MPHETNLFTEETGYNFRKYGKLADQKLLCERMGSVCTAVVQEDENSWSLRENVQLISFESISEVFPSIKQLMIGSPSTYLKVFLLIFKKYLFLRNNLSHIHQNLAMFFNSRLFRISRISRMEARN